MLILEFWLIKKGVFDVDELKHEMDGRMQQSTHE